ncbi:class I SAM-dependent methyltransferase [Phytohabitans houttuyneae]|uniref:class I SAM-dependent methyltransferase n=1 Tax=Phytohabitans houttuyneae TaxID=1076126 RepID=UPI001FE70983|nr:class I SAM-dependent methyltransferase [Phytohabitans houttuyneae]
MDRRLLLEDDLTRSAVVANSAMNRGRQLAGVNSYTRELGFNPLDQVRSAAGRGRHGGWLYLCCGTGRALLQAARSMRGERVALVGVDLVDYFDPIDDVDLPVKLVCASVTSWVPARRFDLITCVHGLHYIGDKLAVLTRAASWLTDDGLLVADLDLTSIRLPDGRPAGRALAGALRQAGFRYDARRRRITSEGRREVSLPYDYLGADDKAGPNYTNQPAVHSYYQPR